MEESPIPPIRDHQLHAVAADVAIKTEGEDRLYQALTELLEDPLDQNRHEAFRATLASPAIKDASQAAQRLNRRNNTQEDA